MLKGFYKKYRKIIIYGSILLFITFLFNILLYEDATKSLYLLSVTCGFSSFVILRENNITVEKLGFGMTRKEIERIFLLELIYILLYSIVLISLDILFVFIVSSKLDVSIMKVIEIYLFSLFLSFFISFIKNNIKNTLKTTSIILLTASLIMIIIFIKNTIITNIFLILIIIALYLINRQVFYNNDIISNNEKNKE